MTRSQDITKLIEIDLQLLIYHILALAKQYSKYLQISIDLKAKYAIR